MNNRATIAVEDIEGDVCYVECTVRPCRERGQYGTSEDCVVYEPIDKSDGLARQYHSDHSKFRIIKEWNED